MAGPPAGGHKAELPGTTQYNPGHSLPSHICTPHASLMKSLDHACSLYSPNEGQPWVTPRWLPAWRNFIESGSTHPFFPHVPTWSCVLPLNIITKSGFILSTGVWVPWEQSLATAVSHQSLVQCTGKTRNVLAAIARLNRKTKVWDLSEKAPTYGMSTSWLCKTENCSRGCFSSFSISDEAPWPR